MTKKIVITHERALASSVKNQRDRIVKEIYDDALEQIAQDELHREERVKEARKERQERFREQMNEVFGVDVGTKIDHLVFRFEDDSGEFKLTVPANKWDAGRLICVSECGSCGKTRQSHPICKKVDFHPILAGMHWSRHSCEPATQPTKPTTEQRAVVLLEELFDLVWHDIKEREF